MGDVSLLLLQVKDPSSTTQSLLSGRHVRGATEEEEEEGGRVEWGERKEGYGSEE